MVEAVEKNSEKTVIAKRLLKPNLQRQRSNIAKQVKIVLKSTLDEGIKYSRLKKIGQGAYSEVYIVEKLDRNDQFLGHFAVKKIKVNFTKSDEEREEEINTLSIHTY